MDVHRAVICFTQTPAHGISSHLSQYLLLLTPAMRCYERMQTAATETENDQKIKLSPLTLRQLLASSPLNATWLMMVRISRSPQWLRLIFMDSTPEINGCFRALALWPQWTVCAAEWRDHWFHCRCGSLRAGWRGIMSRSREKGCSKY